MRVVITNATGDLGSVAAASLRAAGYEVFGIDRRRIPRVAASRHLSGYACIDHADPLARHGAMVEFIAAARADVFLPLCTPGAVMAVQCRRDLEALCHTCVPESVAFQAAYGKRACMEACIALGIPCAGILSRDEAVALLQSPDRSIVIKPTTDVGAATDIHHATTVAQLDEAIRVCRQRQGDFLVQEHIPGPADAMHTVTVLLSRRSRLMAAFTARKLRHWPPTGGVIACGMSTRQPELLDLVMPFFRRWQWQGPAEVELKRDPRDGVFKVIEINPRFPGYLRLTAACGVDMPVLAVRAALGDEPAAPDGLSDYRDGVRYVAPTVFAKSILDDARARGWSLALATARADSAGAGPMLRSLLCDPLPLVTRSLVPTRRCRAATFDTQAPDGATPAAAASVRPAP